MATDETDAVARLRSQLRDANPFVSGDALDKLVERSDVEAMRHLIALLEDVDQPGARRAYAARLLGRFQYPATLAAEPTALNAFAQVLLPTLVKQTTEREDRWDPDSVRPPQVRVAAREAAVTILQREIGRGRIGHEVLKYFIDTLGREHFYAHEETIAVIDVLKATAVTTLQDIHKLFDAPDGLEAYFYAAHLDAVEGRGWGVLHMEIVHGGSGPLQERCVVAKLVSMGDPRAVPILVEVMLRRDRDSQARLEAMRALVELLPAEEVTPHLDLIAARRGDFEDDDDDDDHDVVEAAIETLATLRARLNRR